MKISKILAACILFNGLYADVVFQTPVSDENRGFYEFLKDNLNINNIRKNYIEILRKKDDLKRNILNLRDTNKFNTLYNVEPFDDFLKNILKHDYLKQKNTPIVFAIDEKFNFSLDSNSILEIRKPDNILAIKFELQNDLVKYRDYRDNTDRSSLKLFLEKTLDNSIYNALDKFLVPAIKDPDRPHTNISNKDDFKTFLDELQKYTKEGNPTFDDLKEDTINTKINSKQVNISKFTPKLQNFFTDIYNAINNNGIIKNIFGDIENKPKYIKVNNGVYIGLQEIDNKIQLSFIKDEDYESINKISIKRDSREQILIDGNSNDNLKSILSLFNNDFLNKIIPRIKEIIDNQNEILLGSKEKESIELAKKIIKNTKTINGNVEKIISDSLFKINPNAETDGKLSSILEENIKNTEDKTKIELTNALLNSDIEDKDIKNEIENFVQGASLVKSAISENQPEAVKELGKIRIKALNDKYKTLKELNNNNENNISNIIVNLALGNEVAKEILTETDGQYVLENANSLTEGINKSVNSISNNIPTDLTVFNSQLATNARLAQLTNPYNQNLNLAKILNNLSKDKLADNNSFNDIIKNYSLRLKENRNLWAKVLGGIAQLKDSPNSYFYGASIGYDKNLGNYIFGLYSSYALSKTISNAKKINKDEYVADNTILPVFESNSKTLEFGAYGRFFMNQNEFNLKASFGLSQNKQNRIVYTNKKGSNLTKRNVDTNRALIVQKNIYENTSEFTNQFMNLNLNYGRIFQVKNNFFIKPTIGANYSYVLKPEIHEQGKIPGDINQNSSNIISAELSIELRKYLDENNFIYLMPSIETEILKKNKDTIFSFANSDQKVILRNDKKQKYINIQSGFDFAINEKLSTNLDLGLRTNTKDYFYNASLGIRYKF